MTAYKDNSALLFTDLKIWSRNKHVFGDSTYQEWYNVLTMYADLYPKMVEQGRRILYGPHV